MKEGRGVASVASGEVSGKSVEVENEKGEASGDKQSDTLPQDKTTTQPVKETKRQPPVDANGKPVSVDHHWKEFMKKSGKSGKSQKRKDEKKEKRVESFFDDTETVSTKKVPLRSKLCVCFEQ